MIGVFSEFIVEIVIIRYSLVVDEGYFQVLIVDNEWIIKNVGESFHTIFCCKVYRWGRWMVVWKSKVLSHKPSKSWALRCMSIVFVEIRILTSYIRVWEEICIFCLHLCTQVVWVWIAGKTLSRWSAHLTEEKWNFSRINGEKAL